MPWNPLNNCYKAATTKIHQKAMCFIPLNPFNKCIGVPTPQNTIFRPKMEKKIPFFYPKSVFSGSGWSLHAPQYPILRMLHCQNNVLHAIEPI